MTDGDPTSGDRVLFLDVDGVINLDAPTTETRNELGPIEHVTVMGFDIFFRPIVVDRLNRLAASGDGCVGVDLASFLQIHRIATRTKPLRLRICAAQRPCLARL